MRWRGWKGGGGGSVTKGRSKVVVTMGEGVHNMIDNNCFFKHYYLFGVETRGIVA
jgi:hypothetical protein